MRSHRAEVLELMQIVHRMPLDVAEYFVAEMDDVEIERRFQMYTGMELSADRCSKRQGSTCIAGSLVHAPNDDGRLSVLNSASVTR